MKSPVLPAAQTLQTQNFFFFLLIRQLFVSAALQSHLNTISNFGWKGLFEVYGRHRSVESLNTEGPQPVFIIIITKIQAKFVITQAWGSSMFSDTCTRVSCAVGAGWDEEDVDSVEPVHRLEKNATLWWPQVRLSAHHCHSQHQQPVTDGGKHATGALLWQTHQECQ